MLGVKHAGNLLKDEVPSQIKYHLSCNLLCQKTKSFLFSHWILFEVQ